ncbi:unnamed protein product [Rotaria sordida]|uniref:Uncharacterized protein n=1 Tax=Rotaria sordida TaxID=392033 RepID=A0A814EU29_9BILA|nr:unnamed protein product [Rotaria sordida]CAF3586694.1 unnamed protein product [Rotaria sordida]
MMMNNSGGFYPARYNKSTPFNGLSNTFTIGRSSVPPFYNAKLQQGQQQQQQKPKKHLINEQNHDTISNIPSFKLYDLDTNDNSEIIRLIFSFADVSYKNRRLRQDEWVKIKEQMPFEYLPILRINHEFIIFQLHTIIRYLAREFHLYGTGQHDHAIVDIVHETIREFREKIFQQINNSSNNNVEQTLHHLITHYSTTYLQQLENFYGIFNRQGPFYLGSYISLADLIVYDMINYLIKIDKKLLDSYSHLKEAYRRLEKHPRLFNYINAKINNNEIKKHHHKSPSESRRHTTKSPIPDVPPHQHRHRSYEGHESGHYHHHRHHHHHHRHPHHRNHSKEPTPHSHTKQRPMTLSQSPSISTKNIEPPPIPQTKQQSVRPSHSPSVATKGIELPPPPPVPQTKQRSIRSSKSPSSSRKDKELTPLRATDVIPPPPPPIPQPPPPPSITPEHKI